MTDKSLEEAMRENTEKTFETFWESYDDSEGLSKASMYLAYILGIERGLTIAVEIKKMKDVEASWQTNPDRMGGQFTEDEIARSMNVEHW